MQLINVWVCHVCLPIRNNDHAKPPHPSVTLIPCFSISISRRHTCCVIASLRTRFMGPTWGPSGADRTQMGPMLAPWTLLSGLWLMPFINLYAMRNKKFYNFIFYWCISFHNFTLDLITHTCHSCNCSLNTSPLKQQNRWVVTPDCFKGTHFLIHALILMLDKPKQETLLDKGKCLQWVMYTKSCHRRLRARFSKLHSSMGSFGKIWITHERGNGHVQYSESLALSEKQKPRLKIIKDVRSYCMVIFGIIDNVLIDLWFFVCHPKHLKFLDRVIRKKQTKTNLCVVIW